MRKITAKPNKEFNHGTDTKPEETIPSTYEEAKKKNEKLQAEFEDARANFVNIKGSVAGWERQDYWNKEYKEAKQKRDDALKRFDEYNKEYRRIFKEQINQEFRKPLEEDKSKNTITCSVYTKTWPFHKEIKMHILSSKKPKDEVVYEIALGSGLPKATIVKTRVLGRESYAISAPEYITDNIQTYSSVFPTLRGAKGVLSRAINKWKNDN